jgi:dipeptidyl aminopeptidase/acylaminoacyl peptidase
MQFLTRFDAHQGVWNAKVLKMPIWAFHGLKDTTVLPNQTIDMANALKDWHPDFKLTLYEDVQHGSWEYAFTSELIKWFLTKSK